MPHKKLPNSSWRAFHPSKRVKKQLFQFKNHSDINIAIEDLGESALGLYLPQLQDRHIVDFIVDKYFRTFKSTKSFLRFKFAKNDFF